MKVGIHTHERRHAAGQHIPNPTTTSNVLKWLTSPVWTLTSPFPMINLEQLQETKVTAIFKTYDLILRNCNPPGISGSHLKHCRWDPTTCLIIRAALDSVDGGGWLLNVLSDYNSLCFIWPSSLASFDVFGETQFHTMIHLKQITAHVTFCNAATRMLMAVWRYISSTPVYINYGCSKLRKKVIAC